MSIQIPLVVLAVVVVTSSNVITIKRNYYDKDAWRLQRRDSHDRRWQRDDHDRGDDRYQENRR